jgi:hypothetical protein
MSAIVENSVTAENTFDNSYNICTVSPAFLEFIGLAADSEHASSRTMCFHMFLNYACKNKMNGKWLFDTKELVVNVDEKIATLLNLPVGYKIPVQKIQEHINSHFTHHFTCKNGKWEQVAL